MKLVTLNTWAGMVADPLEKFIQNYSKTVDVFCFQEVFHDFDPNRPTTDFIFETKGNKKLYSYLSNKLKDFTGIFTPVHGISYGLAIFVKNNTKILESGDLIIYENLKYDPVDNNSDHTRKLQWIVAEKEGKKFLIVNIHGHWSSKGKVDTEDRIEQSKRIKDFLRTRGNIPTILCGDLNLSIDTVSLEILEEGMKNLVKEYGVMSTRTSLYTKENKFADYILTSKDIVINRFEVLPEEVSDHSALYLDCEI